MRRTPRSGRSLTAALAVSVLLALSSCGGGDDPEATSSSPTSASSDPSESSSAPSSSDEPTQGEDVDPAEFVAFMKSGLETSTTAQMTMRMDAAGSGINAKGQVDYTTKPPSMAMTMTSPMMGNEPIDMRFLDGVMYMNMGRMSHGKFVKFDLNDASNLPPGMSGLAEQMDPLAAFEQLESAVRSVTFVGDEDVDGEQLAHYRVVLDTSKVKSLQGIPQSAGVPKELNSDLWFDEKFRPRQVQSTMNMGAQPLTTEVRLFDWGEPVQIEAPPADQVVDPSTASG